MYRIRLNYDKPKWAYHRRCQAIANHAPPDFEVDIAAWHPVLYPDFGPGDVRYDLVMTLVPDDKQMIRRTMAERGYPDTVIVGGLNVGYGNHSERLRMCRTGADHIVVNNRDCWERLGRPEGMTWISNGVDRDIFRVTTPIVDRKPRILWSGSRYHCIPRDGHTDSLKGFSEVLRPLQGKLDAAGISHSFVRSNSENPEMCREVADMVEWYNTGTIYVCTSRTEGTPNPALEAAACGCVVVSTRVGNMPELIEPYVNGELVDRDVDAVFEAVERCQARYVEMAQIMQCCLDAHSWDWQYRAGEYYALFRRLIRRQPIATDVPVLDSATAE